MAAAANSRITVITVCRNSGARLEPTLRSVSAQDYADLEYVVVDGASTDETQEILRRHEGRISRLLVESDRGVYEAMNKGLRLATGDRLLFMNAGDVFAADDVLSRAAAATDADVVYGDFEYTSGPRHGRVVADIDKGVFNHQCVLYRKALHATFGEYAVVDGLTAADYLFFMQLRASGRVSFRKLDLLFSRVDPNGMSAGLQTFLQVNLVDGLLQRRGRYGVALRIAAHPVYDFLRRLVRRFR
jgi:glycosyltransferase involved in cell wall biosynthesis